MISSYFSRTRLKRNHSSTSDENDVSISSENDSKKQEKKRMNTLVEDSDMAVQAADAWIPWQPKQASSR